MRAIRYLGSKDKYVGKINSLVNQSKKKIFWEPFHGSCAVLLNLEREFDEYHANDLDTNVSRIFRTLKTISFDNFSDIYKGAISKFGEIGTDKTGYYSFREWYNSEHFGKDTEEEGVYTMMLVNSCINSMARFGHKGFNQGWGNRDYTKDYNRELHEKISSRLKRVEFSSKNFFDIEFSGEELLFLDPPYFDRPSYSYNGFGDDDFSKFLKTITEFRGDVLYTDIFHSSLGWKYVTLREVMRTTSPLKSSEITGKKEVCYYNFDAKVQEASALF